MTDAERRASEARRLLAEPLLVEAFDKIERRCMDELLRLPTWRAHKQRLALVDRINTLRQLRAELNAVIVTGDQASRKKPSLA
jgi:hypothetical protein